MNFSSINIKVFFLTITLISGFLLPLHAQDKASPSNDPVYPYPVPLENQERVVILLPKLKDQSDAKVELMIGKKVMVNSVNWQNMVGSVEKKVLKSHAKSYFVVKSEGDMSSTRLGGGKDVKKFVWIHDGVELQPYFSDTRIVIYIPKGFEVRYRIWNANKEVKKALKNYPLQVKTATRITTSKLKETNRSTKYKSASEHKVKRQ